MHDWQFVKPYPEAFFEVMRCVHCGSTVYITYDPMTWGKPCPGGNKNKDN